MVITYKGLATEGATFSFFEEAREHCPTINQLHSITSDITNRFEFEGFDLNRCCREF